MEVDNRVTTLTINNIHVFRVGEVLALLQDAGFDVEINLSKVPDLGGTFEAARTHEWAKGYDAGYGAGVMDHTTQTNTAHGRPASSEDLMAAYFAGPQSGQRPPEPDEFYERGSEIDKRGF